MNLLEVANRLCLPRLINLIECRVIEDLTNISQTDTIEAVKNCLQLLEPVKVSCWSNFEILFISLNLTKSNQIDLMFDILVAQCASIGRMVYVTFMRQLQYHLYVTEEFKSFASRKSRVFVWKSMATGLVSQRLRLLSTMYEWNESRM